MNLAVHLMAPAGCICLGLLFVGMWTENIVLTRLSRDGWIGATGWRRFFTPIRGIVAAHEALGGRSGWIRAYRAANVAIFTGMSGIIILTITMCVMIKRMN
jgi:hypothetical protein